MDGHAVAIEDAGEAEALRQRGRAIVATWLALALLLAGFVLFL